MLKSNARPETKKRPEWRAIARLCLIAGPNAAAQSFEHPPAHLERTICYHKFLRVVKQLAESALSTNEVDHQWQVREKEADDKPADDLEINGQARILVDAGIED